MPPPPPGKRAPPAKPTPTPMLSPEASGTVALIAPASDTSTETNPVATPAGPRASAPAKPPPKASLPGVPKPSGGPPAGPKPKPVAQPEPAQGEAALLAQPDDTVIPPASEPAMQNSAVMLAQNSAMTAAAPTSSTDVIAKHEAIVKSRAPPKPKSLASPAASQIQSLNIAAPRTSGSDQPAEVALSSVSAVDAQADKASTAAIAEKKSPPPAPGKRAVPAKPTRMSTPAASAPILEVTTAIPTVITALRSDNSLGTPEALPVVLSTTDEAGFSGPSKEAAKVTALSAESTTSHPQAATESAAGLPELTSSAAAPLVSELSTPSVEQASATADPSASPKAEAKAKLPPPAKSVGGKLPPPKSSMGSVSATPQTVVANEPALVPTIASKSEGAAPARLPPPNAVPGKLPPPKAFSEASTSAFPDHGASTVSTITAEQTTSVEPKSGPAIAEKSTRMPPPANAKSAKMPPPAQSLKASIPAAASSSGKPTEEAVVLTVPTSLTAESLRVRGDAAASAQLEADGLASSGTPTTTKPGFGKLPPPKAVAASRMIAPVAAASLETAIAKSAASPKKDGEFAVELVGGNATSSPAAANARSGSLPPPTADVISSAVPGIEAATHSVKPTTVRPEGVGTTAERTASVNKEQLAVQSPAAATLGSDKPTSQEAAVPSAVHTLVPAMTALPATQRAKTASIAVSLDAAYADPANGGVAINSQADTAPPSPAVSTVSSGTPTPQEAVATPGAVPSRILATTVAPATTATSPATSVSIADAVTQAAVTIEHLSPADSCAPGDLGKRSRQGSETAAETIQSAMSSSAFPEHRHTSETNAATLPSDAHVGTVQAQQSNARTPHSEAAASIRNLDTQQDGIARTPSHVENLAVSDNSPAVRLNGKQLSQQELIDHDSVNAVLVPAAVRTQASNPVASAPSISSVSPSLASKHESTISPLTVESTTSLTKSHLSFTPEKTITDSPAANTLTKPSSALSRRSVPTPSTTPVVHSPSPKPANVGTNPVILVESIPSPVAAPPSDKRPSSENDPHVEPHKVLDDTQDTLIAALPKDAVQMMPTVQSTSAVALTSTRNMLMTSGAPPAAASFGAFSAGHGTPVVDSLAISAVQSLGTSHTVLGTPEQGTLAHTSSRSLPAITREISSPAQVIDASHAGASLDGAQAPDVILPVPQDQRLASRWDEQPNGSRNAATPLTTTSVGSALDTLPLAGVSMRTQMLEQFSSISSLRSGSPNLLDEYSAHVSALAPASVDNTTLDPVVAPHASRAVHDIPTRMSPLSVRPQSSHAPAVAHSDVLDAIASYQQNPTTDSKSLHVAYPVHTNIAQPRAVPPHIQDQDSKESMSMFQSPVRTAPKDRFELAAKSAATINLLRADVPEGIVVSVAAPSTVDPASDRFLYRNRLVSHGDSEAVKIAEAMSQSQRAEAFQAARRKCALSASRESELRSKLAEYPMRALSVSERLASQVGATNADSRLISIRRIAASMYSQKAKSGLLALAEADSRILQQSLDQYGTILRGLMDDLRAARQQTEFACTEEENAGVEFQLSASIMQACTDQVRSSALSMVADIQRSCEDAANALVHTQRQLADHVSASTSGIVASEQTMLAHYRSKSEELKKCVMARRGDVRRAEEAQARLETEFTELKQTVDAHRASEISSAAALTSEVHALSSQAERRRVDEAAALHHEVEKLRTAAAAEAEKLGVSMIAAYRDETSALLESVRNAAQARFQAVVDQAGKAISAEFDAVMDTLESKKATNSSRVRHLQEQLAVAEAQLVALRHTPSQAFRPQSNSKQLQLQRLRHAVRDLWRNMDEFRRPQFTDFEARCDFFASALLCAPYSSALVYKLRSAPLKPALPPSKFPDTLRSNFNMQLPDTVAGFDQDVIARLRGRLRGVAVGDANHKEVPSHAQPHEWFSHG